MVHGTDGVWFESQKPLKSSDKKTIVKSVRPDGKGGGSRRIFSPIFKLQVLNSYRQDSDCQGNQRATARKYGIHRRQIQKWLQMEAALRSTVQQSNAALNLSSARPPEENVDSGISSASSPVSTISKISTSTCFSCSSLDSSISCNNLINRAENSDNEEYINVDEISDSEGDELSSCSSDRALDFTCATLSKRRFYTLDFKLHVLEAFRNDVSCKGNQRATARKFGIHRRQVQKWLNQQNAIGCEQDGTDNMCLDLSHGKRKLEQLDNPNPKRKCDSMVKAAESYYFPSNTQESALCLVKEKLSSNSPDYNDSNLIPYQHQSLNDQKNSSNFAHPYQGSALCYSNAANLDYSMYCVCSPWSCCYHRLSPLNSATFETSKYPTYSLDLKFSNYEPSYADIPLQYGFGENFSTKWAKQPHAFYLHEQSANLQVLSPYR